MMGGGPAPPYQPLDENAQPMYLEPEGFLHPPMITWESIYQTLAETAANTNNNISSSTSTNSNNNNNNNPDVTPFDHPFLETAGSGNFMGASVPDVQASQSVGGLDSTLYEGIGVDLDLWGPCDVSAYGSYGFDDASSFTASFISANEHWGPDPAEWPNYLPSDHSDHFHESPPYQTHHHPHATITPSPPTTASSQPNTPADVPDLAISPISSLTSSLSPGPEPYAACHGLGIQQADAAGGRPGSSTTTPSSPLPPPPPPRISRSKHEARTPQLGRTPPPKTELRTREDRILLECRDRGMSYKKIKEAHCFNVSESTLRGRHRALTKHSSLRPRKPIQLLREAVPVFTRLSGKTKVSWKGVSEYIYERGGSHAFAYTTCRRKWCEVTGLDM
ncbi:hypothetical protein E4U41_005042 [Claviceps citrina]|nr:hypothetical protein E4U41_005042 [Claviceps citrina]